MPRGNTERIRFAYWVKSLVTPGRWKRCALRSRRLCLVLAGRLESHSGSHFFLDRIGRALAARVALCTKLRAALRDVEP